MRNKPELVAWVGEDEMGSGKVGIKQALVPAGMIPIVMVLDDKHKIDKGVVLEQMQRQADQFGKTIYLVRYIAAEELIVVRPRGRG